MSIVYRIRALAVVWLMAATAILPNAAAQSPLSADQILDRIVAHESELNHAMAGYAPLVETYIQNLEPDRELGSRPKSDEYFLGKLDFSRGVKRDAFLEERGFAQGLRNTIESLYSVKYLPAGFAQMALIDTRFDRSRYQFDYIRREFLGEVRCMVFDVSPIVKSTPGAFRGRIWVEDRDYHIVRFNGTYNESKKTNKLYFHFDSWREQIGPDVWLPAYIYSEESGREYLMNSRKLQFKAQTRLWGYNIGRVAAQNEFTSMIVDSNNVEDNGDVTEHVSPVTGLRTWERQAEDNVLQRMEKAGVLAPAGEVDKILATVATNLEVTNDLVIEPEIRCRVLLTSPLESFTVGHTIVVSRGLIDVLPDEASLAMVLAHELAHIALGHRLDTKYAFSDRMLFQDHETFSSLFVKRDEQEERAANQKALVLLQKSPYADKLANAGLFLRALAEHSRQLPSLLQGNMGNRLASGGRVLRMPQLMQTAPRLEDSRVEQIAALPLGGRLRVDPWSDSVELVKTQPVKLLSAREKMQFEIAPVYPYLIRRDDRVIATKNNN